MDSDVREAIREGVLPPIVDGGFIPQNPSRGKFVEGLCVTCQARGRTRALATLLAHSAPLIRTNSAVLIASAGEHELRQYRRHFSRSRTSPCMAI